ncbi:uncharacterized protein LOC121725717 [Aricia agestis]|uniref:uncharacterized protein LOC121725717 n=1 Tax=Aricia agestis TaxID=91739 RepID=UPI001C205C23|nr:uncharacterized protein LOC121725717 [Aricia agestis]
MPRISSSLAWDFFQKLNKEKAKCNICGQEYSFKTTTANLKTHLKRKHRHAYSNFCIVKSTARNPELTRSSSVEKDEFEVEALESEDDDDDDPLVNMCNTDEDEEKPASFLEPRPNNQHDNFETLTSPKTVPTCIKTEEYLVSESVHTNHRTGYDEYDHFGLMLTSKIRKIKNVGTREELMNAIQNLAYKFYLRDMKNNSK